MTLMIIDRDKSQRTRRAYRYASPIIVEWSYVHSPLAPGSSPIRVKFPASLSLSHIQVPFELHAPPSPLLQVQVPFELNVTIDLPSLPPRGFPLEPLYFPPLQVPLSFELKFALYLLPKFKDFLFG